MQTRSTIRQVAEHAGVSRTTVSNVMLGRPDSVGSEKRDLVLKAVRELEYVPVRSTLQNRRTETRVIAMPTNDPHKIGWSLNFSTYTGMCEAALEHGYDILTLLRPDPDWAAERSEVQFLDRRSDGIVFASPFIGEDTKTFEVLVRHQIPTVVCYRRDLPAGVAWVDPDNRSAIFQAVDHLIAKGHTKIAYLTEADTNSYDKQERKRFFAEAMQNHGLGDCADWITAIPFHTATADLARQFIARGATAVVCMNDMLAIDLMKAMQDGGLSVPDDLSLTGIDGAAAAAYGLTSSEFSSVEIGRGAVRSLIDVLGGKSAAECCRTIPVHLVERQSVKDLRADV